MASAETPAAAEDHDVEVLHFPVNSPASITLEGATGTESSTDQ